MSQDLKLVTDLKTELVDFMVYHNKSVSELLIAFGTTKVDGIILTDDGEMDINNLRAALSLLRQKQGFKDCPICFMHHKTNFKFKGLIFDPNVRSYDLKDGNFLPILDFKKQITAAEKNPGAPPMTGFTDEWIQENFAQVLQHSMEPMTSFTVEPASDDDSHSEFLAQTPGEISSNLVWIKFNVRLIDTPNMGYRQLHTSLTRDQIEDTALGFISKAVEQFLSFAQAKLLETGALELQKSSDLSPAERSELFKRAKNATIIFKSQHCNILVEKIRYC